MPKVVRTILNRIKIGRELQFDSTSSYACKLAGTPADKCIYKDVEGPYNTYTHKGLPPTPIDNPGGAAMAAAVAPSSGNWLYFVNKDAAGHLFFTNSEKAWSTAVTKCSQEPLGLWLTQCAARPCSDVRSRTRSRRCCTPPRTRHSG